MGQVAGKGSGRAPPLHCAPDLPGSLPGPFSTPPHPTLQTPVPPGHCQSCLIPAPGHMLPRGSPFPRGQLGPGGHRPLQPGAPDRAGEGGACLTRPCHRPSRGPAMLHLPGALGAVQLRPHRHLQGQRNHVQDHTLLPGDRSVPGRRAGRAAPGVSAASPARTPVRWPCAWHSGHSTGAGGSTGAGSQREGDGVVTRGGSCRRREASLTRCPHPQCTPSWGTSR